MEVLGVIRVVSPGPVANPVCEECGGNPRFDYFDGEA